MSLFKNKYKIESSRLVDWDYSAPAYYFVTIDTKNMENRFGSIKDGIMTLNILGDSVYKYWKDIPSHFANVELDEFIIMPNHIHGIIIKTNSIETDDKPIKLGVIINQFKRICTIIIRETYPSFAWQPRYYDHIFRNEEDLYRIRGYIVNNPLDEKNR